MKRHKNKKDNTDEIAYGIHSVESILLHSPEIVLQIFLQKNRDDKRILNIVNLASRLGLSVETISTDKLNNKYEGIRHQGVVARIRSKNKKTSPIEDFLSLESCLFLVLDGVEDPQNIGACLRTADAVGVDAVIVSKNRSPGITPVVRKVASGAAETVPFITVSNLAQTLQQLKENNVWVIGAAGDTDVSVFDCDPSKKNSISYGCRGKRPASTHQRIL